MKKSRLKNSITYLLLALFISMKMTGLHVLSHTDDDHSLQCTICDYAITHNLTPVLTPDSHDFPKENNEYFISRDIFKSYSFIIEGNISTDQLFSRPPPFLS